MLSMIGAEAGEGVPPAMNAGASLYDNFKEDSLMVRKISYVVAVLLTLTLSIPAAAEFIGDNEQEVQAAADPIVDNLLKGYNDGNYGVYSKSFDATLRETFSEKRFGEVRGKLLKSLGKYTGRTYLGFLRKGRTTLVLWKARFDQTADDVLIKLVVSRRGAQDQVVGLWFQ
jgi:hypothetical protein